MVIKKKQSTVDEELTDIIGPIAPVKTRFDVVDVIHRLNEAQIARLIDIMPKAEHRTWLTLHDETFTLYLIRWPEGTQTTIHDHINSSVHVHFLAGEILEELYITEEWTNLLKGETCACKYQTRLWSPADHCACKDEAYIGSRYIHRFTSHLKEAAITMHAYLPRLTSMHNFEFNADSKTIHLSGIERW